MGIGEATTLDLVSDIDEGDWASKEQFGLELTLERDTKNDSDCFQSIFDDIY